eukprot:maker-scaffold470_size172058-snap-gene-0.38 protein:Tk09905 transcript:maker-scaffold470_size172058-snap-gene-0.38-mRNA-1 annotation:"hypothetical protein"
MLTYRVDGYFKCRRFFHQLHRVWPKDTDLRACPPWNSWRRTFIPTFAGYPLGNGVRKAQATSTQPVLNLDWLLANDMVTKSRITKKTPNLAPNPSKWAKSTLKRINSSHLGIRDLLVLNTQGWVIMELTGCEWFTWHSNSELCNMVSGCSTLDDSCTTCTSGENECQVDPGSDFQCGVEGECLGSILDTFSDVDVDACLAGCKDNSKCTWYTYYPDRKVCILFQECTFKPGPCSNDCVSGEQGCDDSDVPPVPGKVSKVILISGRNAGKDVELADLPSGFFNQTSITQCAKPKDYPLSMEGASGGLVGGKVTVCGGRLTTEVLDKCFALDPKTQEWTTMPSPTVPRAYAGSTFVPNYGWWIIGGVENLELNQMATSTEVFDPQTGLWNSGPDLPEGMSAFCTVQIDKDRTFIAGGNTNEDAYLYKTHIHDKNLGSWIQKEDMLHPREAPACAKFTTSEGKITIIIAGGYNNGGEISTVEIYDVETNRFSEGAPLPFPLAGAQLVNDGGNVVLVGGLNPSIYQYSETDWALMPNELKDKNRSYSVILSVTDESFPAYLSQNVGGRLVFGDAPAGSHGQHLLKTPTGFQLGQANGLNSSIIFHWTVQLQEGDISWGARSGRISGMNDYV